MSEMTNELRRALDRIYAPLAMRILTQPERLTEALAEAGGDASRVHPILYKDATETFNELSNHMPDSPHID